MMPVNGRLVARAKLLLNGKHSSSLRQKALTLAIAGWPPLYGRHYNALSSEKPKNSKILMLVVGQGSFLPSYN
jgi:hypothetical protein